MATLRATRSAQYALWHEFIFNIASSDTMKNTSGTATAFSAASGTVYDIIKLPNNAVVLGGDVTVETVSNDTGTATIAVGDSASTSRYLSATTLKTAARTALVPTGFRGAGEDIRITIANQNGNATTGKVSVRVSYIIKDRANEAQPA